MASDNGCGSGVCFECGKKSKDLKPAMLYGMHVVCLCQKCHPEKKTTGKKEPTHAR